MVAVVQQLAGGVDHRDLDAGAQARIEAHGGARAGRRRQQQVAQVGGEHRDRLGSRRARAGVRAGRSRGAATAWRARRRARSPPARRRPARPRARIAKWAAIIRSPVVGAAAASAGVLLQRQRQAQDRLRCGRGTGPGRGATGSSERLAGVEVVGELRPLLSPCRDHAWRPGRRAPTGARAGGRPARRPRRSRSMRIWRAPSSALSTSGTPSAASTNGRRRPVPGPARDWRAGAPRAAPARPRARSAPWCGASGGTAGRDPRAASCVSAAAIAARSSGVSLPCSARLLSTVARRSSRSRR